MLGRIFTVGGYTLLSRLTGFARDIMLAAILGAGPVADAFFVALRLPNHFRAIFAEGAFNAAFVPAYAHLHSQSETSAKLFAESHFHLAVQRANRAAGGGVAVHAAGDRHSGARIFRRSRARRTRDLADADYLSLSAAGHAGHALWRHAQRHASFRQRRGGADISQSVDDGDAGAGGVLSGRRICGGMGRLDRGVSGVFPARGRRRAQRHPAEIRAAQARRRRPRFFSRARAGDARLDGNAGRAVCRYHYRDVSPRRRVVGAVLCRPAQSTADRRDRHCHRHRAAAGNVAAAHHPAIRRAPRRRSAAPSISRCCFRCRSWRHS